MQFTIKQGDNYPPLRVIFRDYKENPIPLFGATVTFVMVNKLNTTIVSSDATILSEADGIVEYALTSEDTAIPGEYLGEFRVIYNLTKIQTVPNNKYVTIVILPKLGG